MTWSLPHISKIYEALGAIGDNRVELSPVENSAKIYSSKRDKFYTTTWNDDLSQMMSNDNSSYWQGKLSYPMIVILMLKGKISYDKKLPELLKGIEWKNINQKFKNDFDKTVEFVLEDLKRRGEDAQFVKDEVKNIQEQISTLNIEYFGKKVRPPAN